MEPVSLSISVVAAIETCVKGGSKLIQACQSYRNADKEISDVLKGIKMRHTRINRQMEMVKDICNDKIDAELLSLWLESFTELEDLFNSAHVLVKTLLRKEKPLARIMYATRGKSRLKKAVNDLDEWEREFDPQWYLVLRSTRTIIDLVKPETSHENTEPLDCTDRVVVLQRMIQNQKIDPIKKLDSIFQSNDRITLHAEIPFSSARTAHCVERGGNIVLDQAPNYMNREAVRNLARKLTLVDSDTMGLLRCVAIVKSNPYRFAFQFPCNTDTSPSPPSSLRHLILTRNARSVSLTDRVMIANSLARSVGFLHAAHLVHKHIRPENILLFPSKESAVGRPFLIGFEQIRVADAISAMVGDDDPVKNIYRHPKRQGSQPDQQYVMQHDIYSLGVCLLELGLWKTLVKYETLSDLNPIDQQLGKKDERLSASSLLLSASSSPKPQPQAPKLLTRFSKMTPKEKKKDLMHLANTQLPSTMGSRYTEVVISCLTCLDKDGTFGNPKDFTDSDGIQVGVRYIEKVCSPDIISLIPTLFHRLSYINIFTITR